MGFQRASSSRDSCCTDGLGQAQGPRGTECGQQAVVNRLACLIMQCSLTLRSAVNIDIEQGTGMQIWRTLFQKEGQETAKT